MSEDPITLKQAKQWAIQLCHQAAKLANKRSEIYKTGVRYRRAITEAENARVAIALLEREIEEPPQTKQP